MMMKWKVHSIFTPAKSLSVQKRFRPGTNIGCIGKNAFAPLHGRWKNSLEERYHQNFSSVDQI